jgi:citrate synthase
MTKANPNKGLAGIVAAESALSFIDGQAGRLSYRGFDIHVLATHASFLEAVFLLWYDALPSAPELAAFAGTLAGQRALPVKLGRLLRVLPADSSPMATLRTAVSVAGQLDPEADDNSRDADLRKAGRLLAVMPTVVAAFDRLRRGIEPVEPDPDLDHAANFLYMLHGDRPSETAARSLHGGANAKAMEMLLEIGEPDEVDGYVDRALAEKRKLMGFGHRVYRTEDPRATHLRRMSEALSRDAGKDRWFELSRRVEESMLERKGLHCNVDFHCATVYYSLGLPIDLYTPLFAIGRLGGWAAHVMEQHANNRLIRPRAEYTGELDRPWVPMEHR